MPGTTAGVVCDLYNSDGAASANQSLDDIALGNESSEFEEMIPERGSSESTAVSESETHEVFGVKKRPQSLLSSNTRNYKLRSSFAGLDLSEEELTDNLLTPTMNQGLLQFGDKQSRSRISSSQSVTSAGTYSALGVRGEQSKIESLQSENFQLKLKISIMERERKDLGKTSENLGDLRAEYEKYKAKAIEMESRVDTLMHQRRRELDEDFKELESELSSVRKELKALQTSYKEEVNLHSETKQQVETLRAQLDQLEQSGKEAGLALEKKGSELDESDKLRLALQEEIEALKDEITNLKDNTKSLEEKIQESNETESSTVQRVSELFESIAHLDYEFIHDVKVSSPTEGILELGKLVVEVFNYLSEEEATLQQAMDQLELLSNRVGDQDHLLNAVSAAFGSSSSHDQLPMQISSVVTENQALQDQLKQNELNKIELIDNMERSHQKALQTQQNRADIAEEELNTLRKKYSQLIEKVEEMNNRSYNILKIFFRRISAQLGSEYMDRINSELNAIVAKSESSGRSKLPLLTDLMAAYVDEFCRMIKSPERKPRELADLKEKVRSLEAILTEELKHRGADKVLLARYKELETKLKDEQEKRRLEYDSYQRKLANLSL